MHECFPTFTCPIYRSLSSVEPSDVWYDLKYPQEVIDEVKLSALQLEAVVYACQKHTNTLADGSRAGFLIGKIHVAFMYL